MNTDNLKKIIEQSEPPAKCNGCFAFDKTINECFPRFNGCTLIGNNDSKSEIVYLTDIFLQNDCKNFESMIPRKTNHDCINCENIVINYEDGTEEGDWNYMHFHNAEFDKIRNPWCQSKPHESLIREQKLKRNKKKLSLADMCKDCTRKCSGSPKEQHACITQGEESNCEYSMTTIIAELERIDCNMTRRLREIDRIIMENNKILKSFENYLN